MTRESSVEFLGRALFLGHRDTWPKISWERRWDVESWTREDVVGKQRVGLRSRPLLIRHVRWELQSDSVEPFADWLKRSETLLIPLLQTIRVL